MPGLPAALIVRTLSLHVGGMEALHDGTGVFEVRCADSFNRGSWRLWVGLPSKKKKKFIGNCVLLTARVRAVHRSSEWRPLSIWAFMSDVLGLLSALSSLVTIQHLNRFLGRRSERPRRPTRG